MTSAEFSTFFRDSIQGPSPFLFQILYIYITLLVFHNKNHTRTSNYPPPNLQRKTANLPPTFSLSLSQPPHQGMPNSPIPVVSLRQSRRSPFPRRRCHPHVARPRACRAVETHRPRSGGGRCPWWNGPTFPGPKRWFRLEVLWGNWKLRILLFESWIESQECNSVLCFSFWDVEKNDSQGFGCCVLLHA